MVSEKLTLVTFAISKEVKRNVVARAEVEGQTQSAIVRNAINEYLERKNANKTEQN